MDGAADDEEGAVKFIANYRSDGNAGSHQECSQFRREWAYLDGGPIEGRAVKFGRNYLCPFGLGKNIRDAVEINDGSSAKGIDCMLLS